MLEMVMGFIFMMMGIMVSFVMIGVGKTSLIIFTSPFIIFGAFIFYKGLKQRIKDKKTEKNGELCFGRIKETKNNGTEVNGIPYQDAYIYAFIPSLGTVKMMKENIGKYSEKYLPGIYVKLKYFENDINILGVVNENEVPQNQLNELKNLPDIVSVYDSNFVKSNTPLQPMDMPSNGVSYAWKDDNNNNQN